MKKLHWYRVESVDDKTVNYTMFCKCVSPKRAIAIMEETADEASTGLLYGDSVVYRVQGPDDMDNSRLCYREGFAERCDAAIKGCVELTAKIQAILADLETLK